MGYSIDLFIFCNKDIDLASLATLSSNSGGDIYYYPIFSKFKIEEQGQKLFNDIYHSLTRKTGFDILINIRISEELCFENFYGSFFEIKIPELKIPSIDSDKTIGLTFKQKKNFKKNKNFAFLQASIKYYDSSLLKKIRIINYSFPISLNLNYIYSSIESDSTLNLLTRIYTIKLMKSSRNYCRNQLLHCCLNILRFYKKNLCCNQTLTQLEIPKTLKNFLNNLLGIIKSEVFLSLDEIKLDTKIAFVYKFLSCPIYLFLKQIYPFRINVTNIINSKSNIGKISENNLIILPPSLPLTRRNFNSNEGHLIDNGEYIFLLIGKEINKIFLELIFDSDSFIHLKENNIQNISINQNESQIRLFNIISELRRRNNGHLQPLRIVYEGDYYDQEILSFLFKDDSKNIKKEFTYVDFIAYIRKCIMEDRNQFSP